MNIAQILAVTLLVLLQPTSLSADEEFPARSLFPKVPTIELESLYRQRQEILIIDVRSSYEYETLHIKNARHLALNDHNFVTILEQWRAKDSRPLVFYCNGHTCKKSYKAAQKAIQSHLNGVFAYDAGIFTWTKAYPDEAVLLGKTPVNPSQLISKETLEKHMLSPEEFGQRVGDNTIVLDIRDTIQKNSINLFPMRQHSVPLDNTQLKAYVERAKNQNKTLLFYDAVGKQVRWLQYYLESEGVKQYYFMKGGAKAFLSY